MGSLPRLPDNNKNDWQKRANPPLPKGRFPEMPSVQIRKPEFPVDPVKENQKRYEEGQRKIEEAEARRIAANEKNKPVVDKLLGDIKSKREKSDAAHSAWINATGREKQDAKQAYDLVNKQFQESKKAYEAHQKSTQSQANKLASTLKNSQAKAENLMASLQSIDPVAARELFENANRTLSGGASLAPISNKPQAGRPVNARFNTLQQQYIASMRAMQSAQGELQTLQEKSQAASEKLYAAAQEKQKTVQTAFDSWQGTKTKQELKQEWERARYDNNMAAREFDSHQRDPEAHQAKLADKTSNPQTPQPLQPAQPAPNPATVSQGSAEIRNTGPENIPSGKPGLKGPWDQEAWRGGTVPTRRHPYLDNRPTPTPLTSFPDNYARLPSPTGQVTTGPSAPPAYAKSGQNPNASNRNRAGLPEPKQFGNDWEFRNQDEERAAREGRDQVQAASGKSIYNRLTPQEFGALELAAQAGDSRAKKELDDRYQRGQRHIMDSASAQELLKRGNQKREQEMADAKKNQPKTQWELEQDHIKNKQAYEKEMRDKGFELFQDGWRKKPSKPQPSPQAPLDKLDSITQARDIHGNEIKTADMLVSGGVKLQQNQRAEKKPESGLQFRTIGGQVRVVGSNQPKDSQAQPAPTSMGQPQPQPMGTPNPKKQPGGMR